MAHGLPARRGAARPARSHRASPRGVGHQHRRGVAAYRISAETLITALSEISKTYRDIDPQRLLNTALTEVQFLNDLSMAVWQEAMARQRAGVRRRDEVERHLISALISRPPRIDEAARLGRLIGMPALGGPWSVIAMSQGTVTEPDDLADLVASVRHALLPANNEYVCGIIDREVVIVTRPLRDPDVLSRVPCAAYGVGAARSGPGSVLETYGEAREALKVALKNGMRYAHIDQIWLDRLLHGSLTPLELADRILAPIAHLPAARRLELERTLDMYLIVDRRITEAARRLHLHPHTVRYRLEQLRQHLGEIMDSHDQRLALQIALRARRATRQER